MAKLVLLLALAGLACTASAQWTTATASALTGGGDAVTAAVTQMLETLIQPKLGLANQFTTSAAAAQQALGSQFAAVKTQAEAALAAYEAQYCSAPVLKKSVKKPAQFVGHGMALAFSTGNCTFNETKWLVDGVKELDCTEPSISYVKTPANFTSHYHKAASFVGKECKIQKTFGEETTKVLYVFDSSQPALDVQQLTATLTTEIKNLLGSLTQPISSAFSGLTGSAR